MGLEVVVVDGSEAGKRLTLPRGICLVLGRDAECDLTLHDDRVSRHHVRLESGAEGVLLVDMSRNGLFVGEERVERTTLVAGDRFRVGKQTLQIRSTGEDSTVASAQARPHDETLGGISVQRLREKHPELFETEPDVPPPALTPRSRVGPYLIVEKFAEGGMGVIYVALRESTRERVAVKILKPGVMLDSALLERFHREIQFGRQLQHPNIIRYIDSGSDGPIHYLVSELVDGRTAEQILLSDEVVAAPRIVGWARQMGEAIVHAHESRILHRDLKPANVVIENSTDAARILDFGLGRALDQATKRLTFTGQTLGTLQYIAPEQLEDAKSVDERADVYGLGVTLYALLAGGPPFPTRTRFQLLDAILNHAPPPILELRPDTPPGLAAAIHRALEKDPASRFATAKEMLDALPR